MSTLLNFLKTKQHKGIMWWLKYYHQEILKAIYEKKIVDNIDGSWKGVKIKSTYKPIFYPKHPNDNNVTLYMEVNNQNKQWKRN